jgi:hypothetical protein
MARGLVLTRTGSPTRSDWAVAGVELAGPSSAISGWDAARLHGLGPIRPPTTEVLVITTAGANRQIGGVRIRPTSRKFDTWLTAAWDEQLPYVRVAGSERAIADTALACVSFADVRAMVTTGVQRGVASPSGLVAELSAAPRNGSKLLRIAVEDILDNARSIAEAEAIDQLRRASIPAFEVNVPIITDGSVVAVADLLWRELRAVLEIDSREFHFGEVGWKATSRRHNRLTSLGLAVVHYPPSAVRDAGSGWVGEVERWLRRRATERGRRFDLSARGVRRPDACGHEPLVLPDNLVTDKLGDRQTW